MKQIYLTPSLEVAAVYVEYGFASGTGMEIEPPSWDDGNNDWWN